ncbi:MAG: hypothetical protein ACTSX9_06250 [Candidatus Njordarchaeales archaeon]
MSHYEKASNAKNLFERVFLGKTRIEKMLSVYMLVTGVLTIISFGYWYIMKIQGRAVFFLLTVVLLFSTSLSLRVQLLKEKLRLDTRAKEFAEKLEITLEEAKALLEAEVETKVYKKWMLILLTTIILGILILSIFPV